MNLKFYKTVIILYGSEGRASKDQHIHKMSIVELRMRRLMCHGHTRLNKIKNDHIYQKGLVACTENKVREGWLR